MSEEEQTQAPESDATENATRKDRSQEPSPRDEPESRPADRLRQIESTTYEIGSHVASGGVGRIDRAIDQRLARVVALKRLRRKSSRSAELRFVREALLTARLQHPGIVPVYEAGRFPDGEPFYAMKLVSGRPLTELLGEAADLSARIALLPHVLAAAEAVAFAHGQQVIHRDLKPANIVVGDYGETVVIDWGLGKDLDTDSLDPDAPPREAEDPGSAVGDSEDDVGLTADGSIVGTPAYMPPEQAEGKPVDARADVYALGAILYHVLTGRPPYRGERMVEIVGQVIVGPPPALAELQPRAPVDLVAVVDKAMARSPAQRYPTAKTLAEDLRRFQTGQLVAAHDYTPQQRLRHVARRYRGVLTAIGVAGVVVGISATVGVLGLVRGKQRADAAAAQAQTARLDAEAAQHSAETERAQALAIADQLRIEQARVAADTDPYRALELLSELSPDYRAWSAVQVIAAKAASGGLARTIVTCDDAGECTPVGANALAVAPAGDRVAVLVDGTVVAVDSRSGRVLQSLADRVLALGSASPDRRVAVVLDRQDVGLLDIDTGAVTTFGRAKAEQLRVTRVGDTLVMSTDREDSLTLWGPDGPVDEVHGCARAARASAFAVDVSENGERIAYGTADGVALVDRRTGDRHELPMDGPPMQLAISGDGRRVAILPIRRGPVLWKPDDTVDGAIDIPGGDQEAKTVTFDRSGTRVVVGRHDGGVDVLELDTGAIARRYEHDAPVLSVASAGPHRIASAAADGSLALIDLDGAPPQSLRGIDAAAYQLSVSADGRTVAALSGGSRSLVWSVRQDDGEIVGRFDRAILGVDVGADGRMAVGGTGGLVSVSDGLGQPWRRLQDCAGDIGRIALGSDGVLMVATHDDTEAAVCVYGRDGALVRSDFELEGAVKSIGRHPDGRVLVATVGRVEVLDDLASDQGVRLRGSTDRYGGAHLLSAGRALAWGYDGRIGLYDRGGQPLQSLPSHADEVWNATVSDDERFIVSTGRDRSLWISDLATATTRRIDVGVEAVEKLAFVGETHVLMTIAQDYTIATWDLGTPSQEPIVRFHGHVTPVSGLALGTAHPRFASGTSDGELRIWDLKSGESRRIGAHDARVTGLHLLPDGSWLSASSDGTLRRWRDDAPDDADGLRTWIAAQLR